MHPRLRLIHAPQTLSIRSVSHWLNRPTEDILASLRPEAPDPLVVREDGAVMNGNTRVFVLRGRSVDVDALPRRPYEP